MPLREWKLNFFRSPRIFLQRTLTPSDANSSDSPRSLLRPVTLPIDQSASIAKNSYTRSQYGNCIGAGIKKEMAARTVIMRTVTGYTEMKTCPKVLAPCLTNLPRHPHL